jgi:hypothetical protein
VGSDTGTPPGDTNSTTDSTPDTDVDTDVPDEESIGNLGDWLVCDPVEFSYDFFDVEYYEEGYGSEDELCRCYVQIEDVNTTAGFLGVMFAVDLQGDANTWGVNGDSAPSRIAIKDRGTGTHRDDALPHSSTGQWDASMSFPADFDDPNGPWYAYASRLNYVSQFVDCDDYPSFEVKISTPGSSARLIPSPRPVSPQGPESDRDCEAGETSTTSFDLVDFPFMRHRTPLAAGGSSSYAGARVKSVTVTNWNSAEQLSLRHGPTELILDAANPSATIPADDWWYGTIRWVDTPPEGQERGLAPELQLELECPGTPAADTVQVNQGYGLTLAQLAQAVDAATGGTGLGELLADVQNPNIPVYALRIEPLPAVLPSGVTHALRVELRGTWASIGLPLVRTGPDSWSLSMNTQGLQLEGTVTRANGTLTLNLSSGSYPLGEGGITLQPASLTLNTLGVQ